MLTFFRTNQIFLSILLIFYILFLRLTVFLAPYKWTPSGEGIFSGMLFEWIGSQATISHILAIFLLLVHGFIINSLVIGNRLSNEINLFPGVFYVLVSCLLPDFLYLSPVLLGNTFVLISLNEIYSTYKNPACADRIFNAGFWIGMASMFYFPFIFYFIFLMAGMNILRAFKIRERLIALIGLLMPYFLTGLYYFWFDQFDLFWEQQVTTNFAFLELGPLFSAGSTFIKISVFILLILFVIGNSSMYASKKNIQVQKKINILYWLIISAGVGMFFQNNLTFEHFLTLAPSLGIFLAFTFSRLNNPLAESLHLLMALGAIAFQLIAWQP